MQNRTAIINIRVTPQLKQEFKAYCLQPPSYRKSPGKISPSTATAPSWHILSNGMKTNPSLKLLRKFRLSASIRMALIKI